MKKVYGTYLNDADARKAMNTLFEKGYTRNDIKIISNNDSDGNLNYHNKDNESFWDKIKETFSPDDKHEHSIQNELNDDERNELSRYESNLQAGEVVVLLEEREENQGLAFNNNLDDHDSLGNNDGVLTNDHDNDERVMELKKEQLNVDKEEVQTGEVDVKKVTREETETIEVPVEKEEIVIERKSAGGREVKDGEIGSNQIKDEEEVHIPIKEERVNVSKDTVVDDEVVISKEKHRENEIITDEVKHEDIEVDGDSDLEEGLKDKNKRSKRDNF